jgi:hypothetical protein
MTITMFDSINLAMLPNGAAAYGGYVNGNWPTFDALKARFPSAHLLSIAVSAGADADCLDCETGDATLAQAPAWFRRQKIRGVSLPAIYTQATNLIALERIMAANRIARTQYRIWSAHYNGEHFCGPSACGYGLSAADGTQWTSNALGRNLDQSILGDAFFGTAPYVPIEVTPGYWRQVADGTVSLNQWAHNRGVVAHLIVEHTLSAACPINQANLAKFMAYRRTAAGTFTVMPAGLVFYSYNK